MTTLENFVASPWADALGWTVLHSLWQGAIGAAILAAVLVATKSPRIRYAAGCVGLFALLAAFGITLFTLAPHAAQHAEAIRSLPFPGWKRAMLATTDAWKPSLALIAPWLAPCWILGVFLFYLRYATGLFSLARLKRRGVCAAPEIWHQKLVALSKQLRVSRPVTLLESSLAEAPILIGHIRPLILMPIGLFSGLPAAQIESILLHELAHIRRHDYLLNALQNMVDGLLFYHPAAWWISHVIRLEREKCCDDVVVRISGDAHEYARALAALEETRWSGREPAIAAKGGSLMKRIRRLLYPAAPATAWTPVFAASAVFIATALSLGAWPHHDSGQTRVTLACDESPSAGVVPYQKWLNEDVFYIIDDAERQAFQKLTSDDERNCFVQQFWERRNPKPGSAENDYKKEHYRRLAYANAHFAAGLPGWQTDRGHMYIVYGPPDEIDSHREATPHPYESWGYRSVEGLNQGFSSFVFVDRTGKGDYHLAPSNGR